MSPIHLRDFSPTDTDALNTLGTAAFEQFSEAYEDWPGFKAKISTMSSLAQVGEIRFERDAPPIHGVSYGIYTKDVSGR